MNAHEGRPAVASTVLVGLAERMIPHSSEATTFRWERACHWWWRSSSRRRRCCLRRRRGGHRRRRHLPRRPWVVRRGRGRGRGPCRPRQRRGPARAPRQKSWEPLPLGLILPTLESAAEAAQVFLPPPPPPPSPTSSPSGSQCCCSPQSSLPSCCDPRSACDPPPPAAVPRPTDNSGEAAAWAGPGRQGNRLNHFVTRAGIMKE